ncbi:ABC transporter permease [Shewanella kaireitica]|uniref:ABC transporter permease n=1 Tax=Shewanella kaireitica TaxID=212021 RepID=UPI00200BF724|nr:FtsX-like permease family protein [Shewanella kaireitica]MCL1092775.1 FtsX-like permease family protein [Shewanella kaireitica]
MFQVKPIISMLMRNKSGPLLLLIQIILSVAIVANASFIISERIGMMSRESGIVEAEVFDFTIYNFDENIEAETQPLQDLDIIRQLDGVKGATLTSMTPLSGGGWSSNFSYGSSEEDSKSAPNAAIYYSDEQFIPTLGLNLIEGRNFYPDEINAGGPELASLAIVSAQFAKDTFGDESALGRVMYRGNIGQQPMTIIGVVEKLQSAWVDNDNLELSIILNVKLTSSFNRLLVRADENAIVGLKEAIPAALHKENPNRVVRGFTTISEHRTSIYRNHELMASVLSLMVVLLLLITSLGLAGMVMFNIERRTKQIGTRRALGAKKRDIVSFFLVENYLLCLIGGGLGGLIAVQLGQQLMTLYSLPKLELIYPIITVAGLLVLTTVAVILPARKAAKISPAIATRSV